MCEKNCDQILVPIFLMRWRKKKLVSNFLYLKKILMKNVPKVYYVWKTTAFGLVYTTAIFFPFITTSSVTEKLHQVKVPPHLG